MKFILIFGPPAVGKMTVGQELEKITGIKLFHNHMTIELVIHFFDYSTDVGKRLVKLFRQEIFEAVADSDQKGLIFTFVRAFDMQDDWDEVAERCHIFESKGGEIFFVELESSLPERIKRNEHPHRLEHKPSKRDVEGSKNNLISMNQKHRLNSFEGEIKRKNYIKIDNTDLSPELVAEMVKDKFAL